MSLRFKKYYIYNSISGIWNSYGCLPGEEEGIYLSLEETSEDTSSSLIKLLGFTPENKKIGRLATEKIISECIVLLPIARVNYEEAGATIVTPTTPPDPCEECPEKDPCEDLQGSEEQKAPEHPLDLYWSWIESAYLFKIRESIINKILGVVDYKDKSLTIFKIKEILENKQNINRENSIVKLMLAMVNYNFPPHLNWLLNKDLPPLAMYTQIVTHKLTQKDLLNIWQGIMPDIAENPEEIEFEIEHFLGEEEMFGGYNLSNILDYENEKVAFKVFKIKQRAKNSYQKDVIKDDYTNLEAAGSMEPANKWYNSNWPYDNFSLVELLRIDLGGEHDHLVDPEDPRINSSVLLPDSGSQTNAWNPIENYSWSLNADWSPNNRFKPEDW